MLKVYGNDMVVWIITKFWSSGILHIIFDVSIWWANCFSPVTIAFVILKNFDTSILLNYDTIFGWFVDIKRNDLIQRYSVKLCNFVESRCWYPLFTCYCINYKRVNKPNFINDFSSSTIDDFISHDVSTLLVLTCWPCPIDKWKSEFKFIIWICETLENLFLGL